MYLKEMMRIVRSKMEPTVVEDNVLEMFIMEAGYDIVNYCNMETLDDIPEALYYTWSNMAVAYLRDHMTDSENFIKGSPGPISEIKELDVSVKYAVKPVNASYTHRSSSFTHILNTYKPFLQKYRRLV